MINKTIKTYKNLIDIIKKYKLEDKKIIVGCEGYLSIYSDEIRLLIDKNIIAIVDNCGNYEDDIKDLLK